LQQAYRFGFLLEDVIRVDTGAIYDLLREGRGVDVGLAFSTDGRIKAYDLLCCGMTVSSSQVTFSPRRATEDPGAAPEACRRARGLADRLDSATMAELNAMVDVRGRPVEEVALAFLRSHGLT
jgi:osmoprotectant transport system substrate-binding protein